MKGDKKMASNRYWFKFESAYMGVAEYTVNGDGQPYRVSVRSEAGDYERSISTYDDAGWQRDVVSAIGLLTASRPIPCAVVRAFNAWRLAEWEKHMAIMRSQPERYGSVQEAMFQRPPVLRGAWYRVTWNKPGPDCWKHGAIPHGWVLNAEDATCSA